MAALKKQLSVAASVYNPYCFCVMGHIIAIALFAIIYKSEIYCSDSFCSFLFNISGLVYQNNYLIFILIATFASVSTDNTIQLRHFLPKECLYNFLMILLSINYLNECKLFHLSYLYSGTSRSFSTFSFVFPCR